MLEYRISSNVSRGTTPSPTQIQCLALSPSDLMLKGKSIESLRDHKVKELSFDNFEYGQTKRNHDISTLSKKVNKINIIHALRHTLKLKYETQKCNKDLWNSDSAHLDEESVLSHSSGSFEEITGVRGARVEILE